jgi:sugar/nucleoside kinase (ribokinase family)
VKRCLFVGLSTIDVVYLVGDFPKPNTKVVASSQDIFVGGPATNAAVTFAHLGGNALLATVVGSHPLARIIRDEAQLYGIRLVDLNGAFGELPPISSIMVAPSGDRTIVSANATRIPFISLSVEPSFIEQSSVLLIDGHYMDACVAWARAARTAGVPVIFDGGSWKPGTEDLLEFVHTAICSASFKPPGCTTIADVLTFLKHRGIYDIAITDGPNPIAYLYANKRGLLTVPQTTPVDTMGAGDILHGAFCFYVAQGNSFLDALRLATQIAAASCTSVGPRAWMSQTASGAEGHGLVTAENADDLR